MKLTVISDMHIAALFFVIAILVPTETYFLLDHTLAFPYFTGQLTIASAIVARFYSKIRLHNGFLYFKFAEMKGHIDLLYLPEQTHSQINPRHFLPCDCFLNRITT